MNRRHLLAGIAALVAPKPPALAPAPDTVRSVHRHYDMATIGLSGGDIAFALSYLYMSSDGTIWAAHNGEARPLS